MALNAIKSTVTILLIMSAGFSLGSFQPFFPLALPYANPEMSNGFQINLVHQLLLTSEGVIAVFMCEIVTCVMRNSFVTCAAIIETSILEFTERLKSHKRFSRKKKLYFRNIIQMISDYFGWNILLKLLS